MAPDTVSTQQCESFLSRAPGRKQAPRYRAAQGLQSDAHQPRGSPQTGFVWSSSVFLLKLLPTFQNQISHQNPNFLLLSKSSNIWQSWACILPRNHQSEQPPPSRPRFPAWPGGPGACAPERVLGPHHARGATGLQRGRTPTQGHTASWWQSRKEDSVTRLPGLPERR